MKNQAYRMTMLFDFYGDLLTERQRDFFDLYYNDDLSLSEIAENYDITRQGVRDNIVRAEKIMEDIEEKTGLIRRYLKVRASADRIAEIAESIEQLNRGRVRNSELEKLCQQLQDAVSEIRRE